MADYGQEDVRKWREFTSSTTDKRLVALAMLQRHVLKHEQVNTAEDEGCDTFPEQYEYEILPPRSIRLLNIYPYQKSPFEPLVVSLHVVNLDDQIPFDALSYTWGPPTWPAKQQAAKEIFTRVSRCYPVYCGNSLFHVTRNLRDALVNLRKWKTSSQSKKSFESIIHTSMAVHTWIDELCIDQENIEERNQQVSLMGEIYSKASLVLGWLGEQDSRTHIAFEMVRQLEQIMNGTLRAGERVTAASFHDSGFWQRVGIGPFSTEQWRALTDLLTREWCTRTWVSD